MGTSVSSFMLQNAYEAAQRRADALFADQEAWTRCAAVNALSMGPFSSDRSIREYAERIWRLSPVL